MDEDVQKRRIALLSVLFFICWVLILPPAWNPPYWTYPPLVIALVAMCIVARYILYALHKDITIFLVCLGVLSLTGLILETLHLSTQDEYPPVVGVCVYVGTFLVILAHSGEQKQSLFNILKYALLAALLLCSVVVFVNPGVVVSLDAAVPESVYLAKDLQWVSLVLFLFCALKFANAIFHWNGKRIYDLLKFAFLLLALLLSLIVYPAEQATLSGNDSGDSPAEQETVSESDAKNVSTGKEKFQNAFNAMSILIIEYTILDMFWQDSPTPTVEAPAKEAADDKKGAGAGDVTTIDK